jgi:predicted AAA+ superfamily ATPase
MRRYNKELYEKTFGENSPYYKKNEAKLKMEAMVQKLQEQAEDKIRGFVKPVKEKKIRRNKDGSIRKSYKRKTN